MSENCFLITCEHGGNDIPRAYAGLFSSPGAKRDLISHRGYDPGSLQIGRELSAALDAEIIASQTTRLLVDLNRSLHHPQLFSKYSSRLSAEERASLLSEHYHPYRTQVEGKIRSLLESSNRVVHLSVHTFTPRFRGTHRPLDLGILYDPNRREESRFSEQVVTRLAFRSSELSGPEFERLRLRVRHNEPYLGIDDGLTTHLRTQYPSPRYLGLEIEINNRYTRWQEKRKQTLTAALANAIQRVPVEL